ncbi:MAG: UDP-N-acetylglucosamine--N-acetylmuramyl-(pentapeptide) pyrophosphoryl-undecaprenol N-acetylglucosamine transferase [Sphaerochaetaceae bacterium]|nr:UDP-N-acetylglucosamine--N-acetylmuramyl-(pentapeptide) pyrophosphoryl-undecaprenol N-acetylglucosamine transferase [Sphaerochaetaceae bacterium]
MKVGMTGGGTLGHILPALSVYSELPPETDVFWIGRNNVAERKIIEDKKIAFYPVCSGKFRRYFSLKNFIDFFKIIISFFQSRKILKTEQPSVLFSKGGFVSVPVAFAAFSLKIPVITHESDTTIGLATRLIAKRASLICTAYESSAKVLSRVNQALIVTGNPVRKELFNGNGKKWRMENKIGENEKLVVVLGGSQGAQKINEAIRKDFPSIKDKCHLILQTGKGKKDSNFHCENYQEVEFFEDDYADVLNASDIVVSRSGAGAISDLKALRKTMILVPLGLEASRGDQILNAKKLMEANEAIVVDDYSLIVENINTLLQDSALAGNLSKAIEKEKITDAGKTIASLIMKVGNNEFFSC